MPRKHPKKDCKNPVCPNKTFIPRRSNQLFCDGCKDDYHNDRRREENKTVFHREKQLRWNVKKLELLSKDPAYKTGVSAEILKHDKIDLLVYTHERHNPNTGQTVYWSHNYGLEYKAETDPAIYFIRHLK